jgi:hypothetical protein
MTDEKDKRKKIGRLLLVAIPLYGAIVFGLLGAFFGLIGDSFSPLSGFLWGLGVGVVVVVVSGAGMLSWEWIKKEANNGKLLPFMLVGFLAAVAISGLLAVNLGKPSCDESGDPPYSSCVSYANNGFETTSTQKWDKFWSTLPITVIVSSLIAIIVRNEVPKRNSTRT